MNIEEIINQIRLLPNPHTPIPSVWGVHMKNLLCKQYENIKREDIFQTLTKEHLIVIYSLTLLLRHLQLHQLKSLQSLFPKSGIQNEIIFGLMKEINEINSFLIQ